MNSKTEYQNAKQKIERLAKDIEQIKGAIQAVDNQKLVFARELENLNNRLPDMLATAFLKEIPASEISKSKARITEIESFIHDTPLTLQGLQERLKALQEDAAREADKVRGYRNREEYERLKQEFESIPVGDKRRRELMGTFQKIARRTGHISEFNRLTK